MFSEQVISKGWHAWDTTIQNISGIHCMYGMTNAKRRKKLIDKFSHILTLSCLSAPDRCVSRVGTAKVLD